MKFCLVLVVLAFVLCSVHGYRIFPLPTLQTVAGDINKSYSTTRYTPKIEATTAAAYNNGNTLITGRLGTSGSLVQQNVGRNGKQAEPSKDLEPPKKECTLC
ncbi:hypothetical protein JYU34_003558 [Plutella xylostella]|uniref:Secreted protein n=1 Tax=Plutella xylostella TaxID=51655 RepID=A0ABQ7R0C1_PLUXY|nr:hypothetical protein JYU34_003558 [Plutella xylostella]